MTSTGGRPHASRKRGSEHLDRFRETRHRSTCSSRSPTTPTGAYEYDEADASLLCHVAPPGPPIDPVAAEAWLKANYATTRAKAVNLIKGNTAVDKSAAWRMFDNWNAAYPDQWIRYEEVDLLPANRPLAQPGGVQHDQPAPVVTVTRNPQQVLPARAGEQPPVVPAGRHVQPPDLPRLRPGRARRDHVHPRGKGMV
ncbi:hypothetical protein [Saccharothrix stipae]